MGGGQDKFTVHTNNSILLVAAMKVPEGGDQISMGRSG